MLPAAPPTSSTGSPLAGKRTTGAPHCPAGLACEGPRPAMQLVADNRPLEVQLQGLSLSGGTQGLAGYDQEPLKAWGQPQLPQPSPQHDTPAGGGKQAGQALLKLLQSGSRVEAQPGLAHQAAPSQPHAPPPPGIQPQPAPAPGLSLSFLNGATPGLDSTGLGGPGLFGSPRAVEQALPSLFTGNSIWSTLGSAADGGGAGGGSSLWGASSIWSSQTEGWPAPAQPAHQQRAPSPLAGGLPAPGAARPLTPPSPLLSPHARQQLQPNQVPLPPHLPQPQQHGYNPLLHVHQQQQQPGVQPPYLHQQPPPSYPPPPGQQHQLPPPQQRGAGLGHAYAGHPTPAYQQQHVHQGAAPFQGTLHHGQPHQHALGPYPQHSHQPQPQHLADFPAHMAAPPGGLLGLGGMVRMPPAPGGPPPPPPPGPHAPKFAPHPQLQQQHSQLQQHHQHQQLGLPVGPALEERPKQASHPPQVRKGPGAVSRAGARGRGGQLASTNVQALRLTPLPLSSRLQSHNAAGPRGPPHIQAPKVMRHQQLKQGEAFRNHFSPKHVQPGREGRCMPGHRGRRPASAAGHLAAPCGRRKGAPLLRVVGRAQLAAGRQGAGGLPPRAATSCVHNDLSSARRWVEVMDRHHSGRLPRSDMGQLDAKLVALAESLTPMQGEACGAATPCRAGQGGPARFLGPWLGRTRAAVARATAWPAAGLLQQSERALGGDHPPLRGTSCSHLPRGTPRLAEEQQRQRKAFERVQEVLTARWPHARVHLFGSVANGLSVRSNNDLDVCLEMAEVGDDQVGWGCGPGRGV